MISTVELAPAVRPDLRGLADSSHVVVFTLLHGAAFDPARHLVRRPRGFAALPGLGSFAQRAKDRPKPRGVTCVPAVPVQAHGIRVRGLDAIDGTPVLDLKPHFPAFEARPARACPPGWTRGCAAPSGPGRREGLSPKVS